MWIINIIIFIILGIWFYIEDCKNKKRLSNVIENMGILYKNQMSLSSMIKQLNIEFQNEKNKNKSKK